MVWHMLVIWSLLTFLALSLDTSLCLSSLMLGTVHPKLLSFPQIYQVPFGSKLFPQASFFSWNSPSFIFGYCFYYITSRMSCLNFLIPSFCYVCCPNTCISNLFTLDIVIVYLLMAVLHFNVRSLKAGPCLPLYLQLIVQC